MKNNRWGILLLMMAFLASCSSTPVDHSKPEMGIQDDSSTTRPPRTFNQFHNDWEY